MLTTSSGKIKALKNILFNLNSCFFNQKRNNNSTIIKWFSKPLNLLKLTRSKQMKIYVCQKIVSSPATQKPITDLIGNILWNFRRKKKRCSFKRFLNPLHSGYRGGEKVKRWGRGETPLFDISIETSVHGYFLVEHQKKNQRMGKWDFE